MGCFACVMIPKVISEGSVFARRSFKICQTYQKFGNMKTLRAAQNQYEFGVCLKLLYLKINSLLSADTVKLCKRHVSQTEL